MAILSIPLSFVAMLLYKQGAEGRDLVLYFRGLLLNLLSFGLARASISKMPKAKLSLAALITAAVGFCFIPISFFFFGVWC